MKHLLAMPENDFPGDYLAFIDSHAQAEPDDQCFALDLENMALTSPVVRVSPSLHFKERLLTSAFDLTDSRGPGRTGHYRFPRSLSWAPGLRAPCERGMFRERCTF